MKRANKSPDFAYGDMQFLMSGQLMKLPRVPSACPDHFGSLWKDKYFQIKKITLFTFSLIALASSCIYAQAQNSAVKSNKPLKHVTTAENENTGMPAVTLGTIETTATSRENILAYPRLLTRLLDCEVTGYDFSLTENGKTWGPVSVKGAVLNEAIKDKIKDLDPVNIKISITNIHVKCGSEEGIAKPINIEYNH
jgi:hypothetical protein